MSHIVKVPGIIISASAIRAKATHITIQCRSCRNYRANIAVKPGLEGYTLPRKCDTYVCSMYMYMYNYNIYDLVCVYIIVIMYL